MSSVTDDRGGGVLAGGPEAAGRTVVNDFPRFRPGKRLAGPPSPWNPGPIPA